MPGIAYNQRTPAEVMADWMSSPGHCRNIMSPDFTEIGVGYFASDGADHMWTQTLGRPR